MVRNLCLGMLLVPSLVLCLLVGSGVADIWTAQIFDDQVQRLDDQTGAVLSGGIASGGGGLSDPAGMALGADGNLYVSSQVTGQILKYNLDGNSLGVFATMPLNGSNPAGPSRLTFGPDGDLYVADFNGPNVRVFDGMTGALAATPAATVAVNVGGMAFGPDGGLYVGDFSAGNVYRVVEGVQEEFITANAGGLQTPGGLFFLPSGDLLVVDLIGNQILQFDANGENPSVWATIPPEISPNPEDWPQGAFAPSHFPSNVILDPDGNLVVGILGQTNPEAGGADNGALLRYDLEGNLLERIVDGLPPVSDLLWIVSPDAIPGNYDGIGGVDEDDFLKWRDDFGKHVAAGGGADGNGDGIVDAADYTFWRDILTSLEMGAEAGSAAVPEPSSLALLAAGIMAIGMRRGRR